MTHGIGIVGVEQLKLTPATELAARELIRGYLLAHDFVVSGECHLGGIDIIAKEEALKAFGPSGYHGYPPAVFGWEDGYKPRNKQIAADPRVRHVVCITLRDYPDTFIGRRFPGCYHCNTEDHVKSGGCWTVKYAQKIGKTGEIVVL